MPERESHRTTVVHPGSGCGWATSDAGPAVGAYAPAMERRRRPTLVEREAVLAALHATHRVATAEGPGRLVLLTGEAGSGKTSVLHAFADAASAPASRVLWGACDSLHTARALGPLLDMAATEPELAAAVTEGASRAELFAAALAALAGTQGAPASTMVVEDAHWADEATLDLISFLGRRLDRARGLLVVTYRNDEVGALHPLRTVLGDLATTRPVRLHVEPLGVDGVAELVRRHATADRPAEVDPAALHRLTGGNAFFVTECLAAGADAVPATVSDAVLARRSTLSTPAREVLDSLCVIPDRVELGLAGALGAAGPALDECVAAGVLTHTEGCVHFRHELARRAVLATVAPSRLRSLHRQVLAHLETWRAVDPARLVHHAHGAGDDERVLRHAPAAADAAAAAGARRQAVAHLELAVGAAGGLDPGTRGELRVRLGMELALLAQLDASIAAFDAAVADFTAAGDSEAAALAMVRRSAPLSTAGREQESVRSCAAAIAALEPLGASAALAEAYAMRCSERMIARHLAEAEAWSARALAIARPLEADATVARTLIQGGVALWMAGDEAGLARIHEGIAIAERLGAAALVILGWSQIGSGGGEVRRYAEAVPALQICIDHAHAHEIPSNLLYATAWLARCRLEQGRWAAAEELATSVLRSARCEGISEITAATVVGRLRARRGDPDPWSPLDRALGLARTTGHLQRLWPVAAARAEAAWLEGDPGRELDVVAEVLELAERLGYAWARDELRFWSTSGRSTAGGAAAPGHDRHPATTTPWAVHLSAGPAAAAAAWRTVGCPFEAALCLAHADDAGLLREAHERFLVLGSRPAARRVDALLRDRVGRGRRGANRSTRANPLGLTPRELDVLRLVAGGRSNRQIAEQLCISPKTADHHVSNLLTKLGAHSRAEAVAVAAAAGVVFVPR